MSRSIIVVDDDDDVRSLATMSLSRVGGYSVRAAASGEECLAMVAQERPDAVLLDVMMPVMDGPATLLALRDSGASYDIPVVFLTAGVSGMDMDRLQSLPVSGVLRKPFDPLTLPAELAAVLGWQGH